jgi:hypothetical protein
LDLDLAKIDSFTYSWWVLLLDSHSAVDMAVADTAVVDMAAAVGIAVGRDRALG